MSEDLDILEVSEKFLDAALDLYRKSVKKGTEHPKHGCKGLEKAPLATYKELRNAFLPTRTKKTVEKACNKIAKSANEMFANYDFLKNSSEPSCRGLGLDNNDADNYDACHVAGTEEKPVLVCDCPDGYAQYTPKDYAKEYVVKCYQHGTAKKPDDEVHLHHSDYPERLAQGYRSYTTAQKENDLSGMVIGCDAMINAVHGSGTIADLFVKGGIETVDKLAKAKK